MRGEYIKVCGWDALGGILLNVVVKGLDSMSLIATDYLEWKLAY